MLQIAILGINSSLAPAFFGYFKNLKDVNVIWVGRTKPNWFIENSKNIFLKYNWNKEDFSLLEPIFDCDTILFLGAKFQNKLLVNSEDKEIIDIIDSILVFPIKVIKRTLHKMMLKKSGHFIFFGSSVADRGMAGTSIYGTCKSSLKSLVQNLAMEYGKFGIRANVIEIGNIGMGMASSLDEKNIRKILLRTASRKLVPSEDVVSTVDYLLNNLSVNGTTLKIDGGYF